MRGAFVKVTQQRDFELENSCQAELKSEIELLKTLHSREIQECQSQIQSLLDSNSTDSLRSMQLEKTCNDLKATVADLSLSLTKLWDMNEREAAEHNQLRVNAATHKKTLDDLAGARSNIGQLNSQLQASQTAQRRTASELGRVKSTLASVKDGAEIELNMVLATLTNAERNCVASQNTQDNMASEPREHLFLHMDSIWSPHGVHMDSTL